MPFDQNAEFHFHAFMVSYLKFTLRCSYPAHVYTDEETQEVLLCVIKFMVKWRYHLFTPLLKPSQQFYVSKFYAFWSH